MNKDTVNMLNALTRLGISTHDAHALRRIAMTLHRWSEHECNGTIQRDGDAGDGKPRSYYENHMGEHVRGSLIPDRERGAQKRLAAIMTRYPELVAYEQGDPRGASLYILKRTDIGDHDIGSIYNRGIGVHA